MRLVYFGLMLDTLLLCCTFLYLYISIYFFVLLIITGVMNTLGLGEESCGVESVSPFGNAFNSVKGPYGDFA